MTDTSRSPKPSRSVGSSRSRPHSPCTTWSWMPPTRDATTGRPFHIGSVTVSPKPSTRLFCTTTAACRCRALTRCAFSSTSSMGRLHRCTRARAAGSRSSHARRHSASTSAPSGSSVTPETSGPTSIRWTSSSRRSREPTKPRITPAMSLSRSQRLTCSTTRASRGTMPPVTSNPWCRRTAPVEPSRRWKPRSPSGVGRSTSRARWRAAATSSSVRWAFLALNGSNEGAITQDRAGSTKPGR